MQGSPPTREGPICVNGDGRGISHCRECRAILCARCAAFEEGSDRLCEPCGNDVLDRLGPRYASGGVLLSVGLSSVVLLGWVELWLVDRLHIGWACGLALAVVAFAIRVTWFNGDRTRVRRSRR